MPVKIKAVQKINPQKRNEPAKWYPQAIGDGETTLNDLAAYASSVSTVSKGDILAVLETVLIKQGKICLMERLSASGSISRFK